MTPIRISPSFIASWTPFLPGRLEDRLDPPGLFGPQTWLDRVLAVVDGLVEWSGIVGAFERPLQVQQDVRIPRQEGDGDHRQPLLQADRIDEKVRGPVEAMDRDVIVVRPGLLAGAGARDGRDVRPLAQ